MKHKHKWMEDGYNNGYICRCGAWTQDKILIHKPHKIGGKKNG